MFSRSQTSNLFIYTGKTSIYTYWRAVLGASSHKYEPLGSTAAGGFGQPQQQRFGANTFAAPTGQFYASPFTGAANTDPYGLVHADYN